MNTTEMKIAKGPGGVVIAEAGLELIRAFKEFAAERERTHQLTRVCTAANREAREARRTIEAILNENTVRTRELLQCLPGLPPETQMELARALPTLFDREARSVEQASHGLRGTGLRLLAGGHSQTGREE